jgi:NAD(P)-dependent dehydrogenase (short-subunit alcohol dehydrogenase family)
MNPEDASYPSRRGRVVFATGGGSGIGASLEGRLTPPEIARMALFLAAGDSRMCTSQNFIVDAGRV